MIRGERWQRAKEMLDRVLDLPPDERHAFLEESCAGDQLLIRQVESLVEEEEQAGDFLETPIFALGEGESEDRTASGVEARRDDSGRRIGPYRLIRQLGEGGMGAVYLAQRADDEYQSQVAIKVIRRGPGSEQLLRRFLVERQILADLNHPNIAELYDGGTTSGDDGGLPYFVMELVDGVTLTEYCDRERLGVAARLDLFLQVCSAVQAAHRNLIVHRDIKPANILVTGDGVPPEGGKRGIPKLLDFGIAKPLDPAAFPQAVPTTGSGRQPMTPVYASPEQIRGETVTTATDVYSLGVVLYELLTGRHPYRLGAQGCHSIEDAVLRQLPSRPSDTAPETDSSGGEISRRRGATPRQLRRRLAGDLDNIVLMALRKDPNRRYASVERLSEDLRRYRQGLPVQARQDTARYRLAKFVRRNKLAVASAAVVATLVLGFAIAMTILAARLKASDREARGLAEQAAGLAEEVSAALDAKQREEAQRKLAEAAKLSLQGESEEAERLRGDVEAARTELQARNLALEELRDELGATSEDDESLSRLAAARLQQAEDRLETSQRQLEQARSRAREAARERDAAIDRAASKERQLETIGQQLAGAREQIRVLESEVAASRAPAGEGGADEPCRYGEELEDQGIVFARVCAGTYTIGSNDEPLAYEDEYPAHEVTLSEFWIGKYEITNEQYRRWRAEHTGETQLPVATVGWTQARKFCKHLGFELPTEAEWEVAARAGGETRWFFGDSESGLEAHAWYEGNSGGSVHPVGLKQANAWGLHDMYGNVWEWVADMWAPYDGGPEVNPKGPPVTPGSRRVVRGGAFDDGPRLLRSAFRGGAGPLFRRKDVGFRCVRRPVDLEETVAHNP